MKQTYNEWMDGLKDGWMSGKVLCEWRDDRQGFRQLDGCSDNGWITKGNNGWMDDYEMEG